MLLHAPDPESPELLAVSALADAIAPPWRVLSVQPGGDAAYQVHVAHLLGVIDQFGFTDIALVGERLGCCTALLAAAWLPDRIGRVALIDPLYVPSSVDTLFGRSLRDCPPGWPALRESIECPLLEMSWDLKELQAFVGWP